LVGGRKGRFPFSQGPRQLVARKIVPTSAADRLLVCARLREIFSATIWAFVLDRHRQIRAWQHDVVIGVICVARTMSRGESREGLSRGSREGTMPSGESPWEPAESAVELGRLEWLLSGPESRGIQGASRDRGRSALETEAASMGVTVVHVRSAQGRPCQAQGESY